MSTAEDLYSNNWKFDFFNYTSVQLEVIVITQRTMFEVKCTDCGQNAMVPFKPTAGKPVYCRACFSKHASNRSENTLKTSNLSQKQTWARRRDNAQSKKNDVHHSVFHWSYNTPKKEIV
jgi:CxxC-x17-CxxC domain-containing protein